MKPLFFTNELKNLDPFSKSFLRFFPSTYFPVTRYDYLYQILFFLNKQVVQGRGEMELDLIHVYDPKENQIFLQENTVFSWYHAEKLNETGEGKNFILDFFIDEK